jgi:tetratricopeptide (TPR) repeat protein
VHWSAASTSASPDLFALQDRMTREIAGALAVNVGPHRGEARRLDTAQRLEAYDFVLRARSQLHRRRAPARARRASSSKRAIEIDPGERPAMPRSPTPTSCPWSWAGPSRRRSRSRARGDGAQGDRARCGPDARVRDAGPHPPRASPAREADAELRRALAINPSDAQALAGRGNVLMWMGERAPPSRCWSRRSASTRMTPIDRIALGLAYYLDGRYDRAVEQLEMNLRGGTAPIRPR